VTGDGGIDKNVSIEGVHRDASASVAPGADLGDQFFGARFAESCDRESRTTTFRKQVCDVTRRSQNPICSAEAEDVRADNDCHRSAVSGNGDLLAGEDTIEQPR
jgi:hypothetical protein